MRRCSQRDHSACTPQFICEEVGSTAGHIINQKGDWTRVLPRSARRQINFSSGEIRVTGPIPDVAEPDSHTVLHKASCDLRVAEASRIIPNVQNQSRCFAQGSECTVEFLSDLLAAVEVRNLDKSDARRVQAEMHDALPCQIARQR